jgi:hypothetical protein
MADGGKTRYCAGGDGGMNLENWQKVTDIALKGFATAVLAVGTFWLAQQRFDMDRSEFCTNFVQQSFEFVQARTFSDSNKSLLDFRIEKHNAICGPLDSKIVQMLNNSWRPPATAQEAQGKASPSTSPAPATKGDSSDPLELAPVPASQAPLEVEANLPGPQWVAVSRRNDESYSALNFDIAAGSQPPNRSGNILRARWFVNIRARNTPVMRGDNPVVGQLLGGQCARILEAVTGTLNEWARVERVPCPPDGG